MTSMQPVASSRARSWTAPAAMPSSSARCRLMMVPSLALEPRLYWLPAALLLTVLLLSFPFHSVAAGNEPGPRMHPLSERQLKRQQDRQRERDRLLVQAGQAFAAGQLEQAERLARRLTAQDRTDPDGLTLLAVIHAAQ